MNRRRFLFFCGVTTSAYLVGRAASSPWSAAVDYNRSHNGVSLLVLHRGKVVFEQFPGSGAYELASGTKSFCGIVACVAQEQKLLHLDETLRETLPEWRDDARGDITVRQLLTLTSGLAGGPIGRPPSYLDALQTQQTARPGVKFQYGPAPFQVFGELLRRKLNADPLNYIHQHILRPAGVQVGHWKRDRQGMPHLPSGAVLTAGDWARFGLWVLNQRERFGVCFTGTAANPAYGLSWWLNRKAEDVEMLRAMKVLLEIAEEPEIPGDLIMAAGAGDQRLYLIPSRELIIVRQADKIVRALLRGSNWSDAEFLKRVLRAV